MHITIELLIAILTTTPAATEIVQDLCDVVHRQTGTPTICKPHKQGAPTFDADVCCAGSSCFAAGVGCQTGETQYYCDLGVELVTGEVECFFEVPNYCDVHPCPSSVAPPPQEGFMCCNQGVCWAHNLNTNDCEIDDIYWCISGVSNPDGTITCLDGEE